MPLARPYFAGHGEAVSAVPAGSVEDEHGVGGGIDAAADLGAVRVDRRGVAAGYDETGPLPFSGQIAATT
ncbi:hypothetical protein ASG40_06845 [Methylobacterium sp. Leaf399]|nr:hypothetical protein ASG40_06845 [Methylobacterium sp. Leaf399]